MPASLELPPDLRGDSVPFQLGLPTADELLPGVKNVLAEMNRTQQIPLALDIVGVSQLTQNLVGLPQEEAMRALRMCILARRRVDAGLLYDKLIGESEKKLQKALELAQKLAPMVLWIDEIEKAFASAGSSGDADAGLSQRLLATLLTWMQDRESGVFLAATSNNISALPPEMLRKGRFDEIFFVDLPSGEVRSALFALHLKKRGRDVTTFDLSKLATASEGFSGAEIEQAIIAGLNTASPPNHQPTPHIPSAH